MGEKRMAEEVGMGRREPKKVKKVAEMVLVLAGMGKMRGGRLPSEAERELMAEAREKLAEVCVAFSPKDVFNRNAFGGVIDDLGFSKLKEQQRLGFRPPKISIVEKLLLSKRKFQMEKSEEFTKSPATSSQRMQGSSGSSIESRGASHLARVTPSERLNHVQISPASLQSSALRQTAATNSTALPYQLPTSEVRSIMLNPLPSSHAVKDSSAALPRVDRPHLRVDGRPNGSSHTSQAQVQAHSGNHNTVRTPTWSVQQPQFVSSSKMASDNKVPLHSNRVEGATDVKSGGPSKSASSNPLVTQTMTVNAPILSQNSQGLNFVQAPATRNSQAPPTRDTHAEISKIIQKLLQPRQPERTAWTPQSKDYMSNAVTCQMCRSAITEVDNVLICDHCDKGFHLKCLQITSQKGLPKDDWHCLRCLSLSNGKPLPPKYGRVMRNNSTEKVSSNMAAVRPSSDRKTGAVDEKINQQKITTNGNIPMTGSEGKFSSQPMSDSKLVNAKAVQVKEISSDTGKADNNSSSGTHPDDVPSTTCNSQASGNQQSKDQQGQSNSVELPSSQSREDYCMVNDSVKSGVTETPSNAIDNTKRNEQESLRVNLTETPTTTSDNKEIVRSSPDNSDAVSWIGNTFQVVEGKAFYQSCCINGVVYKVHHHVLVRCGDGKLIPSKLQAMWEDIRTRRKWVFVNRCYFPSDLPEAVGRPCGLESDEVYESARSTAIMAYLVQGPCEVLPPNKFAVEKERRARLGTGTDDGLWPCYLCKWIYDESKGLFRDISC